MSKQPQPTPTPLFNTLKPLVKKADGDIWEGGAFPEGVILISADYQASGGRKGARKLFEALQDHELYTYVGMRADGKRTFCTPEALQPGDGFALVVSDRSTAEANLEAVRKDYTVMSDIDGVQVENVEMVEVNAAFVESWLSGEGWKPITELAFE